ncbi:miraculin-like protein [Tanacetum coccineum]
MNSATLFLVSVLIFVFTSPSLSTSILSVDDDIVLDYDGNPLEKDVGYVISLPGSRALGGTVWLTPPVENSEPCEADVILVRVFPISGTPFTFTPVNASEDLIKVGSGLAIQSPTQDPCGDTTVWKGSYREGLFNSIITTGGIPDTTESCFRIKKSTPIPYLATPYEFEYCTGVCGPTKIAKRCYPVGTVQSESGEHLAIGGNPLSFYFFKRAVSVAN